MKRNFNPTQTCSTAPLNAGITADIFTLVMCCRRHLSVLLKLILILQFSFIYLFPNILYNKSQ